MSELKSIEYIVKIADEHSITRAAEKLYMTQSALNQQLLKLEEEIGTQLFVRSKTNMVPTEAGEIYLEGAREILKLHKYTYNRLADYVDLKNGYIRVGITPGRGPEMFMNVYPVFHSLYPYVRVEPVEMHVKQQQVAIANGDLDVGFVTLTADQRSSNHYEKLFDEEFLIAVPRGYPVNGVTRSESEPFPVLPLEALRYEPFALIAKDSTMFHVIEPLFKNAGFQPDILFHTKRDSTILSMVGAKICVSVVPEIYAHNNTYPDVEFYSLKDHPKWDFCVTYSRNVKITKAAKEFIRLAKEYWADKYKKE